MGKHADSPSKWLPFGESIVAAGYFSIFRKITFLIIHKEPKCFDNVCSDNCYLLRAVGPINLIKVYPLCTEEYCLSGDTFGLLSVFVSCNRNFINRSSIARYLGQPV